jgi:hypothetical protein
MRLRLFTRCTVWFPTRLGMFFFSSLPAVPLFWWLRYGKSFLSITDRLPGAKILVVEGWIGPDGIRAAKGEF